MPVEIPTMHACLIPANEGCLSPVASVIARLTGARLVAACSLTEPAARPAGDIHPAAGESCVFALPAGQGVQTIVHSAREERAELVALAASGERTSTHTVELARALLDDGVAVLVVPAGDDRAWRPARVGLGYDGGRPADAALAMTRRILEAGRGEVARLDIAYVDDPASARWDSDGEVIASRRSAMFGWWLADRIGHVPAHVRPRHQVGDPAVELAEVSEDLDLLVIGTRGRAPVRRALTGSVSHGLIERTRCPLLIVPPRMAGQERRVCARAS